MIKYFKCKIIIKIKLVEIITLKHAVVVMISSKVLINLAFLGRGATSIIGSVNPTVCVAIWLAVCHIWVA